MNLAVVWGFFVWNCVLIISNVWVEVVMATFVGCGVHKRGSRCRVAVVSLSVFMQLVWDGAIVTMGVKMMLGWVWLDRRILCLVTLGECNLLCL